jgi:hypothetical protein
MTSKTSRCFVNIYVCFIYTYICAQSSQDIACSWKKYHVHTSWFRTYIPWQLRELFLSPFSLARAATVTLNVYEERTYMEIWCTPMLYTYIHIYIHLCIWSWSRPPLEIIFAAAKVYMYEISYIYIYTYIYTCIYIYTYIYVCVYISMRLKQHSVFIISFDAKSAGMI